MLSPNMLSYVLDEISQQSALERAFVEPFIIVCHSRSRCNTLAPKSWLGRRSIDVGDARAFAKRLIIRLPALHRLRWHFRGLAGIFVKKQPKVSQLGIFHQSLPTL